MSRFPIKCRIRVWDKRLKRMVYNVTEQGLIYACILNEHASDYPAMESLGYTDIEGVLVYEEDIVRYKDKIGVIKFFPEILSYNIVYPDGTINMLSVTTVVECKEPIANSDAPLGWCSYNLSYEPGKIYLASIFKTMKVIGNTFQNPELLRTHKHEPI